MQTLIHRTIATSPVLLDPVSLPPVVTCEVLELDGVPVRVAITIELLLIVRLELVLLLDGSALGFNLLN